MITTTNSVYCPLDKRELQILIHVLNDRIIQEQNENSPIEDEIVALRNRFDHALRSIEKENYNALRYGIHDRT